MISTNKRLSNRYAISTYFALKALADFEGGTKEDARERIMKVFRDAGIIRNKKAVNRLLDKMRYRGLLDPIFRLTERGRKVLSLMPEEIGPNLIRLSNIGKGAFIEIGDVEGL